MREKDWARILRRWEPGKGAHRSSWGSLGSENEWERDCVDDEKARRKVRERGKIRPTEVGGYSLGTRISSLPTVEKRRRLLGGSHARSRPTPVTLTADISCVRPTMFSRLPSKLSAPFGILGDEPKLAFRNQPGGIAKLASSRARNLNSIPFQS